MLYCKLNKYTAVLCTEQVQGSMLCCIICSAIPSDCCTLSIDPCLQEKLKERSRTIRMYRSLTYLIGTVEPGNLWGWRLLNGSPANITYTWITKYSQTRVPVVSSSWKNHLWRFFAHPDLNQVRWSETNQNLSRIVYGLLFTAVGFYRRARAGHSSAPNSSLKQSSLLAYKITEPLL